MTRIGTSELDVFPLALGGNTFGWTSDQETSFAVLDAYVATGGNFLDTADGYTAWIPGNVGGESEKIIGAWTAARRNRDSLVIGTKVSQHPDYPGLSAANIEAAAEASLRRLQTDRIDLYYAHYDDPSVPLEETVAAFSKLVAVGKVRYVGVSNYSPARLTEWLDIARHGSYAIPVALQPHYNLVKRWPYETEFAPIVHANHLGVVPYFSLAAGFLTGKYRSQEDLKNAARSAQATPYMSDAGLTVVEALRTIADHHNVSVATVALSWLRRRPGIVAPIASARTLDQLPDLMASTTFDLTPSETTTLDTLSSAVADAPVESARHNEER